MKNRLLQRLGQAIFGRAEPEDQPTAEPLINAEPPEKRQMLQRLLRRRAPKRRHQFASKSMTRGVQRAMERKQRPARLAFIHASMRQGVEAAAQRRTDYLKRRAARWRSVVETNLPRMLFDELARIGIPANIIVQ